MISFPGIVAMHCSHTKSQTEPEFEPMSESSLPDVESLSNSCWARFLMRSCLLDKFLFIEPVSESSLLNVEKLSTKSSSLSFPSEGSF